MKIDFNRTISDLTGQPVIGEDGSPLTLASVSVKALVSALSGDERQSGVEKFRLYKAALAIEAGEDLTAEELAKVKERIGIGWPPLVVGRAYEMIEELVR